MTISDSTKQMVQWIATSIATLAVGALAGKMGWDVATQTATISTLASGLTALIIVVFTIYNSVKGKQAIQAKAVDKALASGRVTLVKPDNHPTKL